MADRLISSADVDAFAYAPGAMESAAGEVRDVGHRVTNSVAGVVDTWAGINDGNYNAPEAPGVQQAMRPLNGIAGRHEGRLITVADAIELGETLATAIYQRRERLLEDIEALRTDAATADDAPPADPPAEGLTGWQADPMLVNRNIRLWGESGTLSGDISHADTQVAALLNVAFDAEDLAVPEWTPGSPAGNQGGAVAPPEGPTTWSEPVDDGAGNTGHTEGRLVEDWVGRAEGQYSLNHPIVPGAADFSGDATFLGFSEGSYGSSVSGPMGSAGKYGQFVKLTLAEATGQLDYNLGILSIDADADAFIGAQQNTEATGGVGGGAGGKVEGDATLGATANANASIELLGLTIGGGVGAKAGADAGLGVEAAASADGFSLSANIGAALGLGAEAKVNLSFSYSEFVKDLTGQS